MRLEVSHPIMVNRVKPVHTSDRILILIDVLLIVNTFFLLDVQINMRRPGHVNVLQWNRKGFFPSGTQS